jgi:nucleotide sugar dehydrogenase
MEQAVLPKLSAHPQIKTFYMPEFLREGKALADFLNPNQLLVAGDKESFAKVADIFPGSGELKFASFKSLEMIKYLNNSFHALKVSFANELGTLATSMGVDHNELFDLFLSDRKLNISEEYLRPGFSFGGTCLNKELSALEELGKVNATDLPLLKSIKVSNNVHRDRFLKEIIEKNAKRILFCGVTFKPGTDDLRESPIMDIIHSLRSLPSYKQAPQILIWDHPKVLANLTELSHFDGDFNELEPSDLVVFGPYAVSDENRKILTSHNVQTLELGF